KSPFIPRRVSWSLAATASRSSSKGNTPVRIAPVRPPGTRKPRLSPGSLMRSTTSVTNSSIRLAPSHDVQRDEPLESQPEAQCPGRCANHDREPRRVRPFACFGERFREHAIPSHCQGQTRVAHHQRVEHSEPAHHSAKHYQESQPFESS